MTAPPRPMFRAGSPPSIPAAPSEVLEARAVRFTGNVVLFADVSEFQRNIADAAYLKWSKAIVIRAMYGTRVDEAWYAGVRRADLHAGGARWLAIYQYIRADQDAAAQGRALAALVGKLQPGEQIIGDLEEGSGNQQARWVAWVKSSRRPHASRSTRLTARVFDTSIMCGQELPGQRRPFQG